MQCILNCPYRDSQAFAHAASIVVVNRCRLAGGRIVSADDGHDDALPDCIVPPKELQNALKRDAKAIAEVQAALEAELAPKEAV